MKKIIILVVNNRFTRPIWKALFFIWEKLFKRSFLRFESQVFFPHDFNILKKLALIVWNDLNYNKSQSYWQSNAGLSWHRRSETYINYVTTPTRKFLFENICEFLKKNKDYDVIEYGCGNGKFITSLAEETSSYRHNYTGIDLNKEVIAHNRKEYKHTKVNFMTGSADEIPKNKNSLIIFCGTFMYIQKSSIRNILNGIYQNKQVLALSENSYDLQSSKSCRRDVLAYSHGYKYLINESELSITHEQIFQEEGKQIYNFQCICRRI